MEEKELFEQLSAAFGETKTKKILKKIKQVKEKSPKTVFNFYFKEDGTFVAVDKKKDVIGD